jgi:mono/diheme cytochrome c family protein
MMKWASLRDPRERRDASGLVVIVAAVLALVGGCETPSPHTISRNYGLRPDIPVDPPRPHSAAEDDCAEGGRLFKYYCGSCHNARALGERPFSNYHVIVTHMRDPAYLTGKEYRQIIMFLRRWHEVGPPTPSVTPSPKRFVFSQPISEHRGESPVPGPAPAPPPSGSGPWQQPAAVGVPPAPQPGATGTAPLPQPGAGGASSPQPPPSGLPVPID